LDFNIERLSQHTPGENVIYERCPVDFLAYIHALDRKGAEALLERVSDAMQHLDLIVYLPLDERTGEPEFPKLQRAVDHRLSSIFRDDEFGIVSSTNAIIVEAEGSIDHRLHTLEKLMNI